MLVLDVPAEMIIFDSKLESWFDKAVKKHCQVEKEKSVPASAYFLIGSFCSDGDIHVAYVARCPLPGSADDSVSNKGAKLPKRSNIRKKERELALLNPEEVGCAAVTTSTALCCDFTLLLFSNLEYIYF